MEIIMKELFIDWIQNTHSPRFQSRANKNMGNKTVLTAYATCVENGLKPLQQFVNFQSHS